MRTSLVAPALLAASANARLVMYADEWHPTRPTNPADRAGIDHVVLAFAMANATALFEPKVPMSTIRSEYPNAKIMIACGGWGDDIGFFEASSSEAAIKKFAADVATMLTNTGADGVDIDWEYPGGNGGDYKQVPNSDKTYQIEAFPKLLAATRAAIGDDKLMSIAVPGKTVDMIAYTKENGPKIWPSVDYINVMSYDLMNRRDTKTKHHTSVADSAKVIDHYLSIEAPAEKMNLGFAYYAKYFQTKDNCPHGPLGCTIVPAEDPVTGKDALTSGAWTFETSHMKPVDPSTLTFSNDGTCGPEKGTKCSTGCCSQYGNCGTSTEHCSGACQHAFGTGCTDPDVAGSWQLALAHGKTDKRAGGQYYFDSTNKLFWTWDTPALISQKFDKIVRKKGLGGVMAWSLGEDSFDWSHIHAMAGELRKGEGGGGGARVASSGHVEQQADMSAPKSPSLHHSPSPASLDPVSSPSKSPFPVVFVDGTPQGPAGDHAAESGAPAGFTVDPAAALAPGSGPGPAAALAPAPALATVPAFAPAPALAPAAFAPAPALVPAPAPAPAPEADASTPQQNKPLAPVAPAGQDPASTSDLPFSPEFLAAMKAAGMGKRGIRGGRR